MDPPLKDLVGCAGCKIRTYLESLYYGQVFTNYQTDANYQLEKICNSSLEPNWGSHCSKKNF